MSLTLEEKQRLAKEQEQAAKLRNQQPLAPQAAKKSGASNAQVTLQRFDRPTFASFPEKSYLILRCRLKI